MNDEKLVSIIIPCYNSQNFINKTLEHLINQSYNNIEIICVNDGSIDNTGEILISYSQKYDFIKVFEKENGGIESAIRLGIKNVTGDFVYLHGHDDYLSKDALEKAINAFTDEDIEAVRMDLFFINNQGGIIRKMQDRRILDGKQALIETIGWSIHTFCLWKTSIFKKIIAVETEGMMDFDELGTRYLYSISKKIGFCEGIYYYLQHDESVSRKITYRFFDRIYTHTLLRKLLINSQVYNQVERKFEKDLFDELVSLVQLFELNKNSFNRSQRARINKIIRTGYKSLNKNALINKNSIFKNRHWAIKILGNYSLKNIKMFKVLIRKNIIR